MDISKIDAIITGSGFSDFRWMNPQDIKVAQWVRVKCTFGCSDYGLSICPPNTPSVEGCKRFFSEYTQGIVIRLTKFVDKENYPSDWSKAMTRALLECERQIFLLGNPKAFLLNQTCCGLCKECTDNRMDCKDKKNARPSPEAFAVDVYQTVRELGMGIEVVTDNPSEIHRYAFILVT